MRNIKKLFTLLFFMICALFPIFAWSETSAVTGHGFLWWAGVIVLPLLSICLIIGGIALCNDFESETGIPMIIIGAIIGFFALLFFTHCFGLVKEKEKSYGQEQRIERTIQSKMPQVQKATKNNSFNVKNNTTGKKHGFLWWTGVIVLGFLFCMGIVGVIVGIVEHENVSIITGIVLTLLFAPLLLWLFSPWKFLYALEFFGVAFLLLGILASIFLPCILDLHIFWFKGIKNWIYTAVLFIAAIVSCIFVGKHFLDKWWLWKYVFVALVFSVSSWGLNLILNKYNKRQYCKEYNEKIFQIAKKILNDETYFQNHFFTEYYSKEAGTVTLYFYNGYKVKANEIIASVTNRKSNSYEFHSKNQGKAYFYVSNGSYVKQNTLIAAVCDSNDFETQEYLQYKQDVDSLVEQEKAKKRENAITQIKQEQLQEEKNRLESDVARKIKNNVSALSQNVLLFQNAVDKKEPVNLQLIKLIEDCLTAIKYAEGTLSQKDMDEIRRNKIYCTAAFKDCKHLTDYTNNTQIRMDMILTMFDEIMSK